VGHPVWSFVVKFGSICVGAEAKFRFLQLFFIFWLVSGSNTVEIPEKWKIYIEHLFKRYDKR
jgi:hypothetical protein